MPRYGTQTPPPSLSPFYPTNQFAVFSAEAVTLAEYSERVNIAMGSVGGQKGIKVEIDFSADPGTVTIDVMESDSDILGTGGYQKVPTGGTMTQATLTTGPNGANTRLGSDLIPFAGQFGCLKITVAPTNVVTVTARITRAA